MIRLRFYVNFLRRRLPYRYTPYMIFHVLVVHIFRVEGVLRFRFEGVLPVAVLMYSNHVWFYAAIYLYTSTC